MNATERLLVCTALALCAPDLRAQEPEHMTPYVRKILDLAESDSLSRSAYNAVIEGHAFDQSTRSGDPAQDWKPMSIYSVFSGHANLLFNLFPRAGPGRQRLDRAYESAPCLTIDTLDRELVRRGWARVYVAQRLAHSTATERLPEFRRNDIEGKSRILRRFPHGASANVCVTTVTVEEGQ